MSSFYDIVIYGKYNILKFLGLIGAFGTGSFVLFLLMWSPMKGIDEIRMSIAYVYITILAVLIPAAELGLMKHRHLARFARFMLSNVGRGFLYIFMGGLLLGQHIGGWVVGVYMIALGVFNMVSGCMTGDQAAVQPTGSS